MNGSIRIDSQGFISLAANDQIGSEGIVLSCQEVVIEYPSPILEYYVHGWQSWSLTTWLEAGRVLPVSYPVRLHPMQTDPFYSRQPLPHSAWVGAARLADEKVLLLGGLALDAHIEYQAGKMRGFYEPQQGEWLLAYGAESKVFSVYAKALGERFGRWRDSPSPRVWCSWYSYYAHIDAALLEREIADTSNLPFDVFQVDDGWQMGIGDWRANSKFPAGMDRLADRIQAAGLTPGLWLAPLLVTSQSALWKEKADWLLRDGDGRLVSAGHNWAKPLYALDTTHPAALEWLTALMKRVRSWGYEYVKLDFLYAGALPGKRHTEMPREQALRMALQVIRESLGGAYLLACGVPILPAIGLCDSLRIGPDVAERWRDSLQAEVLHNFAGPGAQNAIRTSLGRLWLMPLVHPDPDVVYFRSMRPGLTAEQEQLLQDLALITDSRATSDLSRHLTAAEHEQLIDFLQADAAVEQVDRYRFRLNEREVDFAPYVRLPSDSDMRPTFARRLIQQASNAEPVLALVERYYRDFVAHRSLR
jgi:alpha-galactosidase